MNHGDAEARRERLKRLGVCAPFGASTPLWFQTEF